MSTLNILITQLGMFVIYILAGIILIRTHVLSRENMEVVSRLVIKLGSAGYDFYKHSKWSG